MYKVFVYDKPVIITSGGDGNYLRDRTLFLRYDGASELALLLQDMDKVNDFDEVQLWHPDLEFLWKEFSQFFKVMQAAGGLVRHSDGRYLVIKRHGKWDLPKGKLEAGESESEGALREVEEETGVENLSLGDKIEVTYHAWPRGDQWILKHTHWYHMSTDSSKVLTPQAIEDITEAVWLPAEELEQVRQNTYGSIRGLIADY